MHENNLLLLTAEGANCCERVRWALDYKEIPYGSRDTGTPEHADQLARISPFGRVPVLLVENEALSESMAICEYLEDAFPRKSLFGTTALQRARVREACEAVNSSIHPVQNGSVVSHFHPSWSKAEIRIFRANWIETNLVRLQGKLWLRGPFAIGSSFTLADIFLAVMFRKAIALGAAEGGALRRYQEHWRHLMSVPSIAASCPVGSGRDRCAVHDASTTLTCHGSKLIRPCVRTRTSRSTT